MIYQNFDLEIIRPEGGGQLWARVLESPQGDCPFIQLKWPFGADEQNELLADIYGGLRQRRAAPGRTGTIQDFGGKLFDAVFAGNIAHLFRASLDSASYSGRGLRIRLRLAEDSELHKLPWEFLFDTESREFLAVREYTPLVRYLPVAQPIPPIAVEGPLRILVALSSPTDHPRLDIAREWEILCQALEPSIGAGQLELRRVPGRCTFDNLRDALRHFGAHIFHFVGHGLPGALVLEQESGKGLEMEAAHLRSAFPSGALPRLIVLNACSGAMAEDVPFSGLAQGFLKQGVPAVVAMRASITDNAALIFTRHFYRDLVSTGAVDTSLTEARLRMQGNGHPIEWGTPVLYMRAVSGQLFQPAPDAASSMDEQQSLPTIQVGRHASSPKLEPTLGEWDIPSSAQETEPVPSRRPEPKASPKTFPAPAPRKLPGFVVYGLAGGLLAGVLGFVIGVDRLLPSWKSAPPPVLMPAPSVPTPAPAAVPAPAAEPAPAPAPPAASSPLTPDKASSRVLPDAGAQPRPAAPRKPRPAPKAAHPRAADDCRNPNVSERNANCIFGKQ